VVAATTVEDLPDTQLLHAAEMMLSLYLPAAQATHWSLAPVQLASQRHATTSTLLSTECVCRGHGSHREWSVEPYDPAKQFAHVSVGEPVAVENSRASHDTHGVFCRWFVLYVPAGQAQHVSQDSAV